MLGLAGGMDSGRSSVALRIDLPDGRVVVAETSLRLLFSATMMLVAKHGEPFMQHPSGDKEHRLELAVQSLTRQLADAKQRLGEPVELDMCDSDATWERERQLLGILARVRSHLLSGVPGQADILEKIEAALLADGTPKGDAPDGLHD